MKDNPSAVYISAFPSLRLRHFRRASPARLELFQPLQWWGYGRSALYACIQALRLDGSESILMPAYHCGVEIEVANYCGLNVVFYDVRADGSVDVEELRSRLDQRTRAVILIHYYGFPQYIEPILRLCREREIFLIEDCAHALLSRYHGYWLGTFGDATIFSLAKSVPVPDGGALLINNPKLTPVAPRSRPSHRTTLRNATLLALDGAKMNGAPWMNGGARWASKLGRSALRALKASSRSKSFGIVAPSDWEFSPSLADLMMSRLSHRILKNIDFAPIVEKRRRNYVALSRLIKDVPGVELWREELPKGVCPLVLPIRVERRDALREKLAERGIGTYAMGASLHPSVPKEEFPSAARLSEQVLGLPIHQDVRSHHIDYMADTLRALLKG